MPKDMNTKVNLYLDKKGIKHAHLGYRFLREAIRLGMSSPQLLTKIMDIYSEIAVLYDTDASSVERSIRYAISPLRVTNKEFVSKAVDDLYCSLK
jgi:hypothetical protein